jgi:protein-S-isoprenylcysteine O-methyltransferase Ste14
MVAIPGSAIFFVIAPGIVAGTLILGQRLFFGSVGVLEYGIVWAGFHLFVLLYEEPTLRKTYRPEYEQLCANVPRWIPRLRPWSRDQEQG